MDEFLLWLGNKEAFAGPDERACAAIMDGCLNRLMQEGQRELAAALLSGDETTFKLFRTQAPELVHLPDATYEWYAQNYLDLVSPRAVHSENERRGVPGARTGGGITHGPHLCHRSQETPTPTPSSRRWHMRRCRMRSETAKYVAARLGHISDETKLVLDRFGFEPPVRIQTMRTQVRDLSDYDTPPALSRAVTISRAWKALQSDRSIPAIPVTNDDGTLYGMLSPSEIAEYDMQTIANTYAENLPIFNLLNVLDGKIINEAGYLVDRVSGEVSIALPQQNENLLFSGKDSIVICGDQAAMARRAMEMNAQLPDCVSGGASGGASRDADDNVHSCNAV